MGMARVFPRTIWAAVATVMLLAFPAGAQSLFNRAENQVQVALVKVVRTTN